MSFSDMGWTVTLSNHEPNKPPPLVSEPGNLGNKQVSIARIKGSLTPQTFAAIGQLLGYALTQIVMCAFACVPKGQILCQFHIQFIVTYPDSSGSLAILFKHFTFFVNLLTFYF